MECPNCDRGLVKADKFCPACGNPNPGFVKPKIDDDRVTRSEVTRLENTVAELAKKIESKKEKETSVL